MESSVKVRVHKPTRMGILVELLGEFDVGTTRVLGRTLSGVASWGQPVFVDLSGATFMDSSCLWELVVQHALHPDHLALCNPSPQVALSVAACDLEGWIAFHPSRDLTPQKTGELPASRKKGTSTEERPAEKRVLGRRQVRRFRSTGTPFRRRGLQG